MRSLFIAGMGVLLALGARAQTITTVAVDSGAGGFTGQYSSQAVVAGNPAFAYYNHTDTNLMFARNSAADGSGTWAVTTVDRVGNVGSYASLAVLADGTPAISYYDTTNGDLKFARNASIDGSGEWTITTVEAGDDVGSYCSLAVVNGKPAISYHDATNLDLKFARNSAADGSGAWTITTVEAAGEAGSHTSLAVIDGNPAISYHHITRDFFVYGVLKYARNSAPDGSGTWTTVTAEFLGVSAFVGQYTSLVQMPNGNPAISYYDASNRDLKFARGSAPDGSGPWTLTTVDTPDSSGVTTALAIVDGKPVISYTRSDFSNPSLKFARNSAADGSGTWTVTTIVAGSGSWPSLAIIGGLPAVGYYNGDLKFARNTAADGSGSWTITTADAGFESGDLGRHTSHAIVDGRPAISYEDGNNGDLKFARNTAADGSGVWTTTTIDTGGSLFVGRFTSLAVMANGNPAISYYDASNADLKFARCSTPDGSGTWTITTVDGVGSVGEYASLAIIGGNPAISYYAGGAAADLKFARNTQPDGSGTWNIVTVDAAGTVGFYSSLATINGSPAISYYNVTNGHLKFARNSAADGSGAWTIASVTDGAGTVLGNYTSLAVIDGKPAISYHGSGNLKMARSGAADGSGTWSSAVIDSGAIVRSTSIAAMQNGRPAIGYYDATNRRLKFARNSAADGSGVWLKATVNDHDSGEYTSLAILPSGSVGISYYDDDNNDLRWAALSFPADIVVEQPAVSDIPDGGTRSFGPVALGDSVNLEFTIENIGDEELTGVTVTPGGVNAAEFSVTIQPNSPVAGPTGSTTFTARFVPASAGAKSAVLYIASNDPDENPFEINLTGRGLSFTEDGDGDGLNDASELKMAALGFDWEVSQTALVDTLFDNANGAGLFTESQVHALHVDTPLLTPDANGEFKLTIGVQKSTDLINYELFPMSAPQTVINAQGELEFQFTVPDNAAFFRLEAR